MVNQRIMPAGSGRYFLRLLAFTIILAPAALADPTYTENFDTDVAGGPPSESWYTFSNTGSAFVATDSTLNTQAITIQGASSTASFTSNAATGWDLCDQPGVTDACTGYVTFSFDLNTIPASDITFQIKDTTSTSQVSLIIKTTAAVDCQITGPAGSDTRTISGVTVLTNTRFDAVINNIKATSIKANCGVFQTTNPANGGAVTADAANSIIDRLDQINIVVASPISATQKWNIDNLLVVSDAEPPATAIGALATVSIPNLVGLSVDRGQNTIITRHDLGDKVTTWPGTPTSGLTSIATRDVNCDRNDAVLSQKTPSGNLVMFLECDGPGDPDPNTWKIRGSNVNAASPDLANCGLCGDISSSVFVGGDDNSQTGLSEMAQFPIDFSVQSEFFADQYYKTAWAWTGTGALEGEVGVAMYTNHQSSVGAPDDAHLLRYDFNGNGAAEDICTGLNGQTPYLGVVDEGIPSQVLPITFTNDTDEILQASFGVGASFPAPASGAIAIACGGARVAIATATTVSVWPAFGGSPLWQASCTCKQRGLGMSDLRADGKQFLAIADGTNVKMVYANNGTQLTTSSFGGFVFPTNVEVDSNAQYLTVGSNDLLAIYAVGAKTGIVSSPGQTASPTTNTNGLFGGSGAEVGNSLGVGEFGGNLFLGVLLIGMVGGGVGIATKNIKLALLASVLGFLLAWAFGFFSAGVVFAVVVIAGAILWLTRGSGTNG